MPDRIATRIGMLINRESVVVCCVAVGNLWRRKGRLLVLVISTKVGCPRHFRYPHVWMVPSWQGLFSRCRLVSAAVCSAFGRGSHDRWPQCPPRIRSRSEARVRECMGVRPALQRPVGPPKLHITPVVRRNRFVIMLALDHHGPSHPGNLVSKCDGDDFGWSPLQQCREPGPMLRAMPFWRSG